MTLAVGYLGMGSNLGERRLYLQAAVEDLWAHGVSVLASSSVYETEPVGEVTEQPDFLNVCVEMETALAPEALLDACKAVEAALGRQAGGVRHGPRPIDVDILLLEDLVYESPRLRIPHAALLERRFVLAPLVELAPRLMLPGGVPAAAALALLPAGQEVRRVGEPLDLRE